jgi:hypothetical protein
VDRDDTDLESAFIVLLMRLWRLGGSSQRPRAGRLAPAIRYHEKALAIRRSRIGPDHPEVASSLYDLGTAYAEFGQVDRTPAAPERARDRPLHAVGQRQPGEARTPARSLNSGSTGCPRRTSKAAVADPGAQQR